MMKGNLQEYLYPSQALICLRTIYLFTKRKTFGSFRAIIAMSGPLVGLISGVLIFCGLVVLFHVNVAGPLVVWMLVPPIVAIINALFFSFGGTINFVDASYVEKLDYVLLFFPSLLLLSAALALSVAMWVLLSRKVGFFKKPRALVWLRNISIVVSFALLIPSGAVSFEYMRAISCDSVVQAGDDSVESWGYTVFCVFRKTS